MNVLDEYSNYKDFISRINKALKNIGPFERKGLGGKKVRQPLFPICPHIGRAIHGLHWLRNFDIPKETISAGLGHEIGSDVTSIYQIDQKKVDDANRRSD